MPRCKKYEEHIDDHQFEQAKALASEGCVVPAYGAEDLSGAIMEAMKGQKEKGKGKRLGREEIESPMQDLVKRAIGEMMKR